MNTRILNIVIFISAAMIVVGMFLPLTRLPLYGDLSYYRISPHETYIVILFVMLAPLFIVINKSRLLVLSPIGIWLTLFFPVIESYIKPANNNFFSRMGDKMASAMQDVVIDLFLNILELNLGGYIFIAGLFLFTIFSVLRTFK